MFCAGVPVIDGTGRIVDMMDSPDPYTQMILHYYTFQKHCIRHNGYIKCYLEERYRYTIKVLEDALENWVRGGVKEYECWRVLCWGPDLWDGELMCKSDLDVLGCHRIDDFRSASLSRDAVEIFSLNQQRLTTVESQMLLHFQKSRARLVDCVGSCSVIGEGVQATAEMHEVILLPGTYFAGQQKQIIFAGIPTIEVLLYPLSS